MRVAQLRGAVAKVLAVGDREEQVEVRPHRGMHRDLTQGPVGPGSSPACAARFGSRAARVTPRRSRRPS